MISMAYDETRETFRFAWRNERFVFPSVGFVLGEAQQDAGPGRIGASGDAAGQLQGLGNGAASRWNRSKPTRK